MIENSRTKTTFGIRKNRFIFGRSRNSLSLIVSGIVSGILGRTSGSTGRITKVSGKHLCFVGERSGNHLRFVGKRVQQVDFGRNDLLDHSHDSIDNSVTRFWSSAIQENYDLKNDFKVKIL